MYALDQTRARRGLARWVTRWQAFLFFPMLALEGWNLHIASAARTRRAARLLEGALLAGHVAGYLTAVALVLAPVQALASIAVHQAVFGLSMGIAFAPNHKGMPLLSGTTTSTTCGARSSPSATSTAAAWSTSSSAG